MGYEPEFPDFAEKNIIVQRFEVRGWRQKEKYQVLNGNQLVGRFTDTKHDL